jgi:hypothetical protein
MRRICTRYLVLSIWNLALFVGGWWLANGQWKVDNLVGFIINAVSKTFFHQTFQVNFN